MRTTARFKGGASIGGPGDFEEQQSIDQGGNETGPDIGEVRRQNLGGETADDPEKDPDTGIPDETVAMYQGDRPQKLGTTDDTKHVDYVEAGASGIATRRNERAERVTNPKADDDTAAQNVRERAAAGIGAFYTSGGAAPTSDAYQEAYDEALARNDKNDVGLDATGRSVSVEDKNEDHVAFRGPRGQDTDSKTHQRAQAGRRESNQDGGDFTPDHDPNRTWSSPEQWPTPNVPSVPDLPSGKVMLLIATAAIGSLIVAGLLAVKEYVAFMSPGGS